MRCSKWFMPRLSQITSSKACVGGLVRTPPKRTWRNAPRIFLTRNTHRGDHSTGTTCVSLLFASGLQPILSCTSLSLLITCTPISAALSQSSLVQHSMSFTSAFPSAQQFTFYFCVLDGSSTVECIQNRHPTFAVVSTALYLVAPYL